MHRILSLSNRFRSKASASRLREGPVGIQEPPGGALPRALGSLWAELGFLAGLLGVLFWPAWSWIPGAVAAPSGDEATHLLAFLTFQEHFLQAEGLSEWLQPALAWRDHNAYPPLVYLATGLAGAWCGGLEIAGLARTSTGWLALTVVATYFLGRNLFGGGAGRLIGATTAAVVAFTPITLTQSCPPSCWIFQPRQPSWRLWRSWQGTLP